VRTIPFDVGLSTIFSQLQGPRGRKTMSTVNNKRVFKFGLNDVLNELDFTLDFELDEIGENPYK